MTIEKAIKALKEGKKIRKRDLDVGEGYYRIDNGKIVDEDDSPVSLIIFSDYLFDNNWEIFKEPVLDKQEKIYLENFLRPYTKRFDKILIRKNSDGNNHYYLCIAFKNDKTPCNFTDLPFFDMDEHMYDGMKVHKNYTPEELGLFKE